MTALRLSAFNAGFWRMRGPWNLEVWRCLLTSFMVTENIVLHSHCLGWSSSSLFNILWLHVLSLQDTARPSPLLLRMLAHTWQRALLFSTLVSDGEITPLLWTLVPRHGIPQPSILSHFSCLFETRIVMTINDPLEIWWEKIFSGTHPSLSTP